MKFDLEWLCESLETAPGPEVLSERLTACGFNVETREPAGASEVWDVDVTTNRPDAMNHRGLAREAAVATGAVLRPVVVELAEGEEPTGAVASVTIGEPGLCSRYVARVVRGVTVGPSPSWLAERLERCGVRPLNAVVDATNYILLALGQPLHAFDLDRLAGRRVVVRRAHPGEGLETLDGVERRLGDDMLVIADAERAVAVAGVMGGAGTEISASTTDILIESAHFDALSVRRTARALGLHTEASHRFERGADPEMAATACDLAAALIAELAGGTVLRGRVDAYPAPPASGSIRLSLSRLAAFAGLEIPADEVIRILDGLELAPSTAGGIVTCTVPSFRVDLERVEDLYEEVIRHVGYDTIPSLLPVLSTAPGERRGAWPMVDRARDAAVGLGLAEVVTFSFGDVADDELAATLPLAHEGSARLTNPLASTQAVMRRSLLPGLLAAARDNLNRGETGLALFEQGRVFGFTPDGPREAERLGIVLAGPVGSWDDPRELDFAHLKGLVEEWLERFPARAPVWRRGGAPWLDEREGAVLELDGRVVGAVGRAAEAIVERWQLKLPVWVAELDLDAVAGEPPTPRFEPLPRHPGVTADMTVQHPRSLDFAELVAAARELSGEWVEEIDLVGRYSGEGLPEGAVRTTLRLVYRHPGRSLTQDEVNAAQERLRGSLAERLGVSFA